MKFIIALSALLAVAFAAPQYQQEQVAHHQAYHNNDVSKTAKILRYDAEQGFGAEGYKYAVETSDGIVKEEQATFENAGTKEEALRVVGRYLYPGGPNGELLTVEYVADKNGFQPVGAHLPTPPSPVAPAPAQHQQYHGQYNQQY